MDGSCGESTSPLTITIAYGCPSKVCSGSGSAYQEGLTKELGGRTVEEFHIGAQDMATLYMSPDPYHEAFEQMVNLRKIDLSNHPTGGMILYARDGRIHLALISPGSPAARIHGWRARIQGAWLIKVGETTIGSIADVT